MKARKTSWIGLAAAAVILVLALITLPQWWQQNPTPSTPRIGGPFSLVDQTGRAVTDADYRGKFLILYFGYSSCPDQCPTTLANLTTAWDRLSDSEKAQVTPIFITVDPARDTVEKMAAYVGAFSPALVGLTGSPEQVQAAIQAYHIYARKVDQGDGNYAMDHSSLLSLVGKDGRYLGHLDANASADQLVTNIRKLLGSAS